MRGNAALPPLAQAVPPRLIARIGCGTVDRWIVWRSLGKTSEQNGKVRRAIAGKSMLDRRADLALLVVENSGIEGRRGRQLARDGPRIVPPKDLRRCAVERDVAVLHHAAIEPDAHDRAVTARLFRSGDGMVLRVIKGRSDADGKQTAAYEASLLEIARGKGVVRKNVSTETIVEIGGDCADGHKLHGKQGRHHHQRAQNEPADSRTHDLV